MAHELAYDPVLDSQRHFRAILEAMSRPGTITTLDPIPVSPPAGLNAASALAGFALLDANVTFHLAHMSEAEAAYLSLNTGSAVAPMENASFIFMDGQTPASTLEDINCGTLTYPDTGATVVIQVEALSSVPLSGGAVALTLAGPGIDGRAVAYVRSLNVDLLLALQARNAEFPLGIDALVTCDDAGSGARVMGIPRTTKVSWEMC